TERVLGDEQRDGCVARVTVDRQANRIEVAVLDGPRAPLSGVRGDERYDRCCRCRRQSAGDPRRRRLLPRAARGHQPDKGLHAGPFRGGRSDSLSPTDTAIAGRRSRGPGGCSLKTMEIKSRKKRRELLPKFGPDPRPLSLKKYE